MAKKAFAGVTTDEKIRTSLVAMTDRINEEARDKILLTYNDKELQKGYQKIRDSGIYQKAHGKAHHRKIVEFPNPETFEFVDTIMNAKYGDDWLYDNRALRSELVRPWWVVKSL